MRVGIAIAAATVSLLSPPARAALDANHSQPYATGGYGIIIMGSWTPPYDEYIELEIKEAFRAMTENLAMSPDNVWVLVDNGQDDWAEGLFDVLPATKASVAATFQTIGQRMWEDDATPQNLSVILAGHGASGTLIVLADGFVSDTTFVNQYVGKINDNSYGGSPIERLDVLITICYSGGVIGDFRDYFQSVRGSVWPNARHLSIQTASDGNELSTSMYSIPLLQAMRVDGLTVPDLNGDGVPSIYEYFDHACRNDPTNPPLPYTPTVSDTIHIPGEHYFASFGTEHPLYYEWNGFGLDLKVANGECGVVELDPPAGDPNYPFYVCGTEVTLTVTPETGRRFVGWWVYDPNYPDDVNHAATDGNCSICLIMDTDRSVTALFLPDDQVEMNWRLPGSEWHTCGAGVGSAMVSLLWLGCAALTLGRRRRL